MCEGKVIGIARSRRGTLLNVLMHDGDTTSFRVVEDGVHRIELCDQVQWYGGLCYWTSGNHTVESGDRLRMSLKIEGH